MNIMEGSFLERYGSFGPGESTLSFSNRGGDALTSELWKLLALTLTKEQILKNPCKLVIAAV